MMNAFRLAACLWVGAIASSSVAHAASAVDQLKTFVTSTRSAKGEFTQRILKNGRPPQVSSGTFAFTRPGKFRWTVTKPFEQVLVADGQNLWIYDKDLNQVTVRTLNDALGESPAAILFGGNDLDKRFVVTEAGQRDGVEWFDAVPRNKESTFERVSIGMRNGVPEAMELRDAFGQVSVLQFQGFMRNIDVPTDSYVFVPPKGADVLKQ